MNSLCSHLACSLYQKLLNQLNLRKIKFQMGTSFVEERSCDLSLSNTVASALQQSVQHTTAN